METIDRASLEDLPALVELLGILFEQESDFHGDPAKQERGLRLILESPEAGVLFVARKDGRTLGMVNLLFSISTAEGARVCWLEDMIVHPGARGGGLGSRLLSHALAFADEAGIPRVTLLTDGENDGAKRFYARHGFEVSSMSLLRRFGPGQS